MGFRFRGNAHRGVDECQYRVAATLVAAAEVEVAAVVGWGPGAPAPQAARNGSSRMGSMSRRVILNPSEPEFARRWLSSPSEVGPLPQPPDPVIPAAGQFRYGDQAPVVIVEP
ncbi:hypothetical protein GCM10010452_72620 [Crossiella cryophila]